MRKSYWLVGLLGVVVAACMWVPAFSGDEEDQPMRPPRGGRNPMPMMGPPASICSLGNFLYVVRGNTIYKIDPESLSVVKKAAYEEEPKPPRPQDGGDNNGQRRGPQGGPQGGSKGGPQDGPDDGGK